MKTQRKEIQKLKNRISAQISRDKKKYEFESIQAVNMRLEDENKRLLEEIALIQQENSTLLKRLRDFKCNKCGFCQSDGETGDSNENSSEFMMSSPARVPLSRTSSYSLFLGTLTILGALTLFCIAIPFVSNDPQMRGINMFHQINQTAVPEVKSKKYFFNSEKSYFSSEKSHWRDKTVK